jgi:hypothetical protein
LIDQRVGFGRRGDDDLQFVLVDAAADVGGHPRQLLGLGAIVVHPPRQFGVLPREGHDAEQVQRGQGEDHHASRADQDVDGALVVERAGGEVGSQH